MSKRATLKDVAARAGVAANTASSILNERAYCWASAATRERVFQAARELGYRPNRTAVSLKRGRSRTLALLVPETMSPFHGRLIHEMDMASEALGYELVRRCARGCPERERTLLQQLDPSEMDGVITWVGSRCSLPSPEDIPSGYPVLMLGSAADRLEVEHDAVWSDLRDGLGEAVRRLLELGHRRFLLLGGGVPDMFGSLCPESFHAVLAEHGIGRRQVEILPMGPRAADARRAMSQWLETPSGDRATALFATSDNRAIGAVRAIFEKGLKVPGDFSVVGVEDAGVGAFLPVSLAGIRHHCEQLASSAVRLVTRRIESENGAAPRIEVVPAEFIPRESLAQAPRRGWSSAGLDQ